MHFLLHYLLGVCIVGIIYYLVIYHIKGFREYLDFLISEAKKEVNNILADNIDNDQLINSDIFMVSLLSYLGFIIVLLNIIGFISWKNLNK